MKDKDYIMNLEAELKKEKSRRKEWVRKYESEHQRANSLDKKYNLIKTHRDSLAEQVKSANSRAESADTAFRAMRDTYRKTVSISEDYDAYKKGWNEARDLIDKIRHRLHIDDKDPDSYILDRLRSITESRDCWEDECCKWREEAIKIRGALVMPYSADTDTVVCEIRRIKSENMEYAINKMTSKVAVDIDKLRRFKQELGDILGISKEASYPEFVKAVATLKNANETQAKSIHDTLDALIKLRKEKDDEERKLRDLLNAANRRRDEAIELNDGVWRDLADIWAICCDTDSDDAVGLGFDDLISDIFEFCDRHSTADNNEASNRKLICELYSSIFGLEAGSKASTILISEIIKKLETWESDRLEEKKHFIDEQAVTYDRARKAEKKLEVIKKIVGVDGTNRNLYKY